MTKDWDVETSGEQRHLSGANSDIAKESMRGFPDETGPPDKEFIDREGRNMALRTYKNGDVYYLRAYDVVVQAPPDRPNPGQAGYANLHLERDGENVRARLQDIKVTPHYARAGTGSQMLSGVEEIARQNLASEIYGDAPSDDETRHWYARRGYQFRGSAQGQREVFKLL